MELVKDDVTITDNVVDLTKAILKMWEWTHHKNVKKHYDDSKIDQKTFNESMFREMRLVKEGAKKDILMLAILVGDKVTGMATITGGTEATYNLITDAANWKKKIATKATDAIFQFLFEHGVESITIKYPPTNKPAKKFFSRYGFKPIIHIESLKKEDFKEI